MTNFRKKKKKHKAKSAKGKVHGWSPEVTRLGLLESSLSAVVQVMLCSCSSESWATGMKCSPSGKLIRNSVPRVFTGGLSHRHPLLAIAKFQTPRIIINHNVCTYSGPFLPGKSGNLPGTQVHTCQLRANFASRPFSRELWYLFAAQLLWEWKQIW